MAQQPSPDESQPPGKKHEKKTPAEVKPQTPQAPKTEAPAHAPKAEAPAVKEPAAAAQPSTADEPPPVPKVDKKKGPSNRKPAPAATAPETKTPAAEQPATSMTPAADTKKQNWKDKKAAAANASPSASPAADKTKPPTTPATTPAVAATTPAAKTTPAASVAPTTPATTPAVTASTPPAATSPAASVAPSVAQTSPTKPVNPAAAKKLDTQKVQQIKQQHTSFRAQARPDRVPPVTFSAEFRLPGAERWSGPQYEVYRSYHPERHDRGWYHQHYQRVELIAGGYYYFNSGYWYPAWGYDSGNQYYAYDAPIYVGKRSEPPDKVIADVQAALQEMGYYKGEVDGLIGPLTREALTGYQNDQGLVATAVIDEPTLDSLGMG